MTTLFQMAEYCLDPEEIGSHIGGATLTPSHVTFSFWGKCRQQLWFVVKQLGIDIHTEVHMMNGMQAGNNTEPVELKNLPKYDELKVLGGWSRFIWQLEKLPQDGGLGMEEGLAPAWFVREWGPAALWAAEHGLGVIVLSTWGGSESSNMELEHVFCEECLDILYPSSVHFA